VDQALIEMWIAEDTRVIIQGITGSQGSYHAKIMCDDGVKVAAGVTTGKGGQIVHGIPVYDTVKEAMTHHKVDMSLIMVPPSNLLQAAIEAIENHVETLVIITEHVPVHDTMKIKALADRHGVRLVGPNSPGLITPGRSKVGIMPAFLYGEGGNIAIVSRSGTLSHETASNLTFRGLGISSVIGVGGDPIVGLNFVDALKSYLKDPNTEAVILLGEIGGRLEEEAAQYLKSNAYPKPVFAFIAGRHAPRGKKMGHAGAIIEGETGSAVVKIAQLAEAGVTVAESLEALVSEVEAWHRDSKK
jgi:succinyl-CoA synthetase alpha subunit